jgi:hypothetical protein
MDEAKILFAKEVGRLLADLWFVLHPDEGGEKSDEREPQQSESDILL